MAHEVTIKVNALTPNGAKQVADLLQTIGQNIDKEALSILAKKSQKSGMSQKVKQFKHLI